MFSFQLCEGGTINELVNGLLQRNRRMSEEHIAYVLVELIKVKSKNSQSYVIEGKF